MAADPPLPTRGNWRSTAGSHPHWSGELVQVAGRLLGYIHRSAAVNTGGQPVPESVATYRPDAAPAAARLVARRHKVWRLLARFLTPFRVAFPGAFTRRVILRFGVHSGHPLAGAGQVLT
jgi:hypothetical protein